MENEEIPKKLYHSCEYRSRNSTRKFINYKKGEICINGGTNDILKSICQKNRRSKGTNKNKEFRKERKGDS